MSKKKGTQTFELNSDSLLSDRLDVDYYKDSQNSAVAVARQFGLPFEKLGNLVDEIQIGKYEKPVADENAIDALKSSAIKPFHILGSQMAKFPEESGAPRITVDNDILVNLRGESVGNTAIASKKFVGVLLAQGIALIKCKTTKIMPWYLMAYLNSPIGNYEIKRLVPSTRSGLSISALQSLDVILPPFGTQERFTKDVQKSVNMFEKERLAQIEKESELLHLIWSELDVPENIESSTRQSKLVSSDALLDGERWDAAYIMGLYGDILEGYSKYPIFSLGSLARDLRTGMNPPKEDFSPEGIPFIRITEMSSGNLDLENCKAVLSGRRKSVAVSGDVLISTAGTLGATAVIPDKTTIMASTGLAIITPDSKMVDPNYLAIYIKTIGADQINRYSTGGTIPHINLETLKNVQIIVPDIKVQKEIVNKYSMLENEINGHAERKEQILNDLLDSFVASLGGR